ncbi:hypothetical protein [Sorangium sp. So ce1182]|uniref:hypothetical protein n=1 Tax=Sorangium sp. So ce1182 TaxID=3133334 RepID=UPI003F6225B5
MKLAAFAAAAWVDVIPSAPPNIDSSSMASSAYPPDQTSSAALAPSIAHWITRNVSRCSPS